MTTQHGNWMADLDPSDAFFALVAMERGVPQAAIMDVAREADLGDLARRLVQRKVIAPERAAEIASAAKSYLFVCLGCRNGLHPAEVVHPKCVCGKPLRPFGPREEFEKEIPFFDSVLPRFFAGRYKLVEKLGAGGMGTVFRAKDLELDRTVAVKVMNTWSRGGDVEARFRREAESIAKLDHPGIIQVYDCGSEGEIPYYAMELLRGESLDALNRARRLPLGAVLRIVRDCAFALHHAHSHGIVHRDIKPHNIMIVPQKEAAARPGGEEDTTVRFTDGVSTPAYRVVLMDFGVAKVFEAVTQLTVQGDMIGTPHYMSPEQAQGLTGRMDARSDVFSLGVVLYQLVTGKLPFEGKSTVEMIYNIVQADPKPIPRVDPDLKAVIDKALMKEQHLRYATALEFADDCDRFLRGESVTARRPGFTYLLRKRIRRNLHLVLPAAAALLMAVGFAVWSWGIAPAIARRNARRELGRKESAFLAKKRGIEEEARGEMVLARDRYDVGAFVEAAGKAAALVDAYGKYASEATFPRAEFDWDPSFARHTPFRVPVTEALLLIAKSHERRGAASEALRAYVTASETSPEALFEAAHHFLRRRSFEPSAHLFERLLREFPGTRAAAWAAFYAGFACSGAGRTDDAAAHFEALRGVPPDLPRFAEFFASERVLPLYEHGNREWALREASRACAMFSGATEVQRLAEPLWAGDIDRDGRAEILSLRPGEVDVLGWKDGKVARARTLRAPSLPQVPYGTTWTWGDLDGDGVPECVVVLGVPERHTGEMKVLKIREDRLDEVYSDPLKSYGFARIGDLDGDGRPEILVAESWYARRLRIYRGLRRTGERVIGSDIHAIEVCDLDGDGRAEVLMTTGSWTLDTGYRVWAFRCDPEAGTLTEVASRPIGLGGWGRPALFPDAGGCTILLPTARRLSHGRSLDFAFRKLKVDPAPGLWRIRFENGAFGAPERLLGMEIPRSGVSDSGAGLDPLPGAAAAELFPGGRSMLLLSDGGRTWEMPLAPTRGGSRPALTYRAAGDLDGDGDLEIVDASGEFSLVRGLGRATPAPRGDGGARDERSSRYRDAVHLLPAVMESGRDEEAIAFLDDLVRRFPEFEKETLLHAARLHQRSFRWEQLDAVLTRLRTRFSATGPELEEMESWAAWVRRMLDRRERAVLDFSAPASLPTLLVSDPLLVRL
ncbi:MAG: protein kinase, partial [Planctomycetes bacterium]|nr:protein kinase [Planctomycetota bacterium]